MDGDVFTYENLLVNRGAMHMLGKNAFRYSIIRIE